MSTSLDLWYTEINPDIPDIPLLALQYAVREAAITFCEKTHLWKADLDRISIVADTNSYALTVPTALSGDIIVVDNVKYKGDGEDDDAFTTVDPMSEIQGNKNRNGGWKDQTVNAPFEYYVDPVDVNTLYIAGNINESSTEGLLVNCVLKPSQDATEVADFLYTDHRKTIGFGAKADLFMRKGMPWYDPQLASSFERKFNSKCGDGKQRRIKGATNMDLQVKMRPMA